MGRGRGCGDGVLERPQMMHREGRERCRAGRLRPRPSSPGPSVIVVVGASP